MKMLSPGQTSALLKKHNIPAVKQFLAVSEKHAVTFAKRLGFPVVMKISSPEIIHKTDSKGVLTGVSNEKEVSSAYETILKNAKKHNPKARIDGVLVQQQLEGREVIIGAKQDPQFGPVLMFGLGGIFVEVLKDVSFRLIPIQQKDAREMISEIKGYPLLAGIRGEKPINFKKLESALLAVSKLVEKTPKIKELDINPLFASPNGAWAADVRILI
ncbi:MAG: acetate--CoA ligase family protein [Candidatus Aenigmarchaeota archaeon]|nr:acetate--CoA ligase family protein [Candidatus Aenigmarchaeota archaeon]